MEKSITTKPAHALLARDYMDDLGEWLRRQPGSREAFVRVATDALYEFRSWGGKLVTAEGETIEIVAGLFDDVHSENSCGEWVSEQRRRGARGTRS